jgi:hypothetical protein
VRVGVGVRVDVGWRVDVGVALPCSQGNVETCVYCLNSRRLLLQDTDDRPTQVRQNDSHRVSAAPLNPLQAMLGDAGNCGWCRN